MAMVDADWSVDRATGDIRYIGDDHTLSGGTPSYATVIQAHRWIQAFADNEAFDSGGADTDNVEVDIINKDPSARSTDNIITLNDYTATGGVKYNFDATAIEHLYDGTINQGSNLTAETWDGIVNFGNADAHIQVLQDGAVITDDFWNYGHEAGSETGGGSATVMTDSTLGATVDEFVGYTIINVTDGSRGIITENTATTVTVTELYGGTLDVWTTADVHNIAVPLNGDSAQGISHRFLLKTRDLGVDIDRRRLIGTSRRYGNTYSEFKINGTSQGNNVLALSDSGDLNNTTSWATIDAIVDIANIEGLRLIDISGDGSDEQYYSEWDRGANTINTFYEYGKKLQADATVDTLNSLNGENFRGITHSYDYDTETGTNFTTNDVGCYGTNVVFTGGSGTALLGEEVFEDTATPVWKGRVVGIDDNTGTGSIVVDVEFGTVTTTETFSTTNGFAGTVSGTPTAQNAAGRAIFYAVDDQGVAGFMYVQVLAGVAPVDGTRIYFGNATADVARFHDVDIVITERTISTPFVGVSTSSALIGSYGLGLEATDTAAADTYFDLGNNPITPPNTVTFVASGFISGDYVLCTEDNGGDINFTQMVSDTTLSGAAVTAVSVVAIPSDTPLSAGTLGGIRVERDDGLRSLHRYTSFSTSTNDFTIPSFDFSTNNATTPFDVFVSYIDVVTAATSEQFQYVYSSDRTHFLRVRDGGATPIKTAEATGDMTNTGGVASVNRIDDT